MSRIAFNWGTFLVNGKTFRSLSPGEQARWRQNRIAEACIPRSITVLNKDGKIISQTKGIKKNE